MKKAFLLVNLGSPRDTSVKEVRRYLGQFLMDKRVIDVPYLLRRLIVSLFVLPFRPKKSARAYRAIWWKEGSPLLVLSQGLQRALQSGFDTPVVLAMRYGEPSIQKVILDLWDREKPDEIFLYPLYPHHSMSTTETVVAEVCLVLRKIKGSIKLRVLPPFYRDPLYIKALVKSAEPQLEQGFDHLLFSFHGLPIRHLQKTDSTKVHCFQRENCCQTPSDAHKKCYRHQVFETVKAFVELAEIPKEKYSITFQSRFGKDSWTSPFAQEEIPRLAREGIRKMLVICPGFTTDCLETLEELGIRGRDLFLEQGGQEFQMIPCLNNHPDWIEVLQTWMAQGRGEEYLF